MAKTSQPNPARSWPGFLSGVVMIVLLTVVVYIPALKGGFIWDDDVMLTENPLIKMTDGLRYIWFSTQQPDYFPLTSTAFWIQWRLWGENPFGYHLVNVLLHAVGCIVLWRTLLQIKVPGAYFASLIFAVHPVCVASVAWIAELKNTLSFVFFALSFLWFLKADEGGKANRRVYIASFLSFALALFSKTSVVILPCVLLLYLWWRDGKLTITHVRRISPFLLLSLIFGIVTVWFQTGRNGEMDLIEKTTIFAKVAGAGFALWFYLGKALWPTNLSMIYPQANLSPASLASFLSIILWCSAFICLFVVKKVWARVAFAVLGYFTIALIPVLGIVDMSFFMYSRVADHWQYLALIGVIVGVCVLISSSVRNPGARITALSSVIVVCAGLTWKQASVYKNAEALWQDTLQKNPSAWAAHCSLGKILVERGDVEPGISHYTKALELNPRYADAHYNLGNALAGQNKLAEASAHFAEAIRLKPRYPAAHYNLGLMLERQGNGEKALEAYLKTLEINPRHANAHNNAANLLARAGKSAEAIEHYTEALQQNPQLADAYNNLANVLSNEGKLDEAIGNYSKALELKSDFIEAHHNFAVTLQRGGRINEAIQHFETAISLRPNYLDAHLNFANLLFAQGRFEGAVEHYMAATRLDPQSYQAHYNLALALIAQNKTADAVQHLNAAVQLNPDFTEAKEQLAKLGK